MRLLTARTPDGNRAARQEGDEVVLLPFTDVGALISSGEGWRDAAAGDGPRQAFDGLELAAVVPKPGKVLCLGLNYATHIREMGHDLPPHPTLFGKFARTLTGPHDVIPLPPESDEVDWEAEMALVVGRTVRRATREQAIGAIAGYTVANDISMRDWQWRTTQWLQGKIFDSSTPLGPVLVTPDELGAEGGKPDLEIRCEVDGELMQTSRTGDLLFDPADIVVYISTILTLEPGDVILTGTPGGVGAAREPRVFLQVDQTVRTSIEGIGELVNRCEKEQV